MRGNLLLAAAIVGMGLWCLLASERDARRVRDRMAEGGDRFFEEQRTYRAYPGLADPRRIRIKGWALMLVGMLVGGGCLFLPI